MVNATGRELAARCCKEAFEIACETSQSQERLSCYNGLATLSFDDGNMPASERKLLAAADPERESRRAFGVTKLESIENESYCSHKLGMNAVPNIRVQLPELSELSMR